MKLFSEIEHALGQGFVFGVSKQSGVYEAKLFADSNRSSELVVSSRSVNLALRDLELEFSPGSRNVVLSRDHLEGVELLLDNSHTRLDGVIESDRAGFMIKVYGSDFVEYFPGKSFEDCLKVVSSKYGSLNGYYFMDKKLSFLDETSGSSDNRP